MRFRSKFGLQGWFTALMFVVFNLPWVLGKRMNLLDKTAAIACGACLLLQLLARYFDYWDLDETSMRVHRLGSNKTVPYAEILRVTGDAYRRQRATVLKITYSRASDSLKVKRLYVNPADVRGFVRALQKFAPSTAVDV